jgi:hypothetical protein
MTCICFRFGKDLDIFSSLAAGTGAGYMWVTMGEEEKAGRLGGTTLPIDQVNNIAACAVKIKINKFKKKQIIFMHT